MNASVKGKATPINTPVDESNLPIPRASKEERERRRLKLEATMDKVSNEAREKGLTDEILEELLMTVIL